MDHCLLYRTQPLHWNILADTATAKEGQWQLKTTTKLSKVISNCIPTTVKGKKFQHMYSTQMQKTPI